MELLGLRLSTTRCTSLRAHLCLLLSICLLSVIADSSRDKWMRKLPSSKQTTWSSHHSLAKRSRTPTVEGVPRCADPGVPEDGRRVDSVTVLYVGLSLRFVCNPGFLLRGSEVLTCQYGEWNQVEWNADLPQCVGKSYATPSYLTTLAHSHSLYVLVAVVLFGCFCIALHGQASDRAQWVMVLIDGHRSIPASTNYSLITTTQLS